MKFNETSIAIPGARSERQLLGRQPLHREIDTEGWTNSSSVDALALGGSERGRQFLGLLSVSAGRVPSPTLSSGDRIDPLVDHRVEAVSALCNVPTHGFASLPGHRLAVEQTEGITV